VSRDPHAFCLLLSGFLLQPSHALSRLLCPCFGGLLYLLCLPRESLLPSLALLLPRLVRPLSLLSFGSSAFDQRADCIKNSHNDDKEDIDPSVHIRPSLGEAPEL